MANSSMEKLKNSYRNMRRNILNKQDFETIQEMKEKYQILNEEKVRLEEMNDYLKKKRIA